MDDQALKPTRLRHRLGHYATEYGISLRTAKRWKARGYPLDDPIALLKIIGSHHVAPPGLKLLLGRLAS